MKSAMLQSDGFVTVLPMLKKKQKIKANTFLQRHRMHVYVIFE